MIASLDQKIQKFFERHPYLSLTTSRPKPQKTYEKITIVWINFGNKLLSSFLLLAVYLFLNCLCYRRTQRTTSNAENTQLQFGSPLRDPFFDPSPPLLGFRPILWKPLGYIN